MTKTYKDLREFFLQHLRKRDNWYVLKKKLCQNLTLVQQGVHVLT